jgi:bacitracin transport system ATP-binding protein
LNAILETAGLTKRYGDFAAVDDMSLSVNRGEIYGFLGMNGAGKTTTIRMMLGLIRPDSGSIRLFGEELSATGKSGKSCLSRVGSMVEFSGFYENLTARENLEIVTRIAGVKGMDPIGEALDTAGLKDDPKKRAGQFSLGMKQRLGIARALVAHPELVILDEPTNGLDPAGIRDIRNLIVSLSRERNVTVFMSSHVLSEVEQIADRVGIIHHGKLLEETTIESLRGKNRSYVEYGVSDENRAAMLIEREAGIRDFEIADGGIIRAFSRLEDAAAVNRMLVENGIEVFRVNRSATGLEEYFLGLTGEKEC